MTIDQKFCTMKSASAMEAFDLLSSGALLVDLRYGYEVNYRILEVPKTFFLAPEKWKENFRDIPKDELLVLVDNVGVKSPQVACFLKENGYENIVWISGGVIAWAQAGLPVTKDADYELVGGCACKLKPAKPKKEGSLTKKEEN